MIEVISLVVAGAVIEYGLFTSWRRVDRLLDSEEREKSVFEFLE